MAKAKTKRAGYKCGSCGESGHNARTCPNQVMTTGDAEPDTKVEEKKEPSPGTVPIEPSVDLATGVKRGDSAQPPGAFECPSCLRAAVLVLVELDGGTKQLKCEYCHNKTPIKVILKWGCTPADKPKR